MNSISRPDLLLLAGLGVGILVLLAALLLLLGSRGVAPFIYTIF